MDELKIRSCGGPPHSVWPAHQSQCTKRTLSLVGGQMAQQYSGGAFTRSENPNSNVYIFQTRWLAASRGTVEPSQKRFVHARHRPKMCDFLWSMWPSQLATAFGGHPTQFMLSFFRNCNSSVEPPYEQWFTLRRWNSVESRRWFVTGIKLPDFVVVLLRLHLIIMDLPADAHDDEQLYTGKIHISHPYVMVIFQLFMHTWWWCKWIMYSRWI